MGIPSYLNRDVPLPFPDTTQLHSPDPNEHPATHNPGGSGQHHSSALSSVNADLVENMDEMKLMDQAIMAQKRPGTALL